jgi:hypothetical protein
MGGAEEGEDGTPVGTVAGGGAADGGGCTRTSPYVSVETSVALDSTADADTGR